MQRDDGVRRIITGRLRLGRLQNHDPRSRAFQAFRATERVPVLHRRWSPVLSQGDLGACTGFAMAHAINMAPVHRPGARYATEADARMIYSRATSIDPYPGAWPPQDTGSDGLSACKAAIQGGYITGYKWAFGLEHVLDALQLGPVMLGTEWRQGMFTPDRNGYVHLEGDVVGGHEYVLMGDDCKGKLTLLNSWGKYWGKGGRFYMTPDTLGQLLAAGGDAVVPERIG